MRKHASDHYALLRVSRNSTTEQIHQAYRQLAKKYHPDVSKGNDEYFKILSDAYRVLKDPAERARYDASLNGTEFGYYGSPLQEIFDTYFSSYFVAIFSIYTILIFGAFLIMDFTNFALISASFVGYGFLLFLVFRRFTGGKS